MKFNAQNASILGVAALLTAAAWLYAGPLNPPTGPIASTGKTLGEIEPRIAISSTNTPGDANSLFRITQPGSYYLTGNITGVSGKHGIEIAVDGVSIDLCGFVMQGVAGSLDAITTDGIHGLIHIERGSIGGWGQFGIFLSVSNAGESHTIESVDLSGTFRSAIWCGGGSAVRNCHVSNTLGTDGSAVVVGPNSVVQSCTVSSNSRGGISVGEGSSVADCVARFNGATGINTGVHGIVRDCAASRNSGSGISVGYASVVSNCTSSSNTGWGFGIGDASRVSNCVAASNTSHAYVVSSYSIITDCLAENNGGKGFSTQATGETGIRFVRNTSSNNAIGFQAWSGGNFFEGNIARFNTLQWDLATGNYASVIAPTSAGVINGATGGVSIGTTSPYVNFSY